MPVKKFILLFRTAIVGGVLFLAPFAVLLIILGKVHKLAEAVVVPLAQRLPFPFMMGLTGRWILATLFLVVVCILAGLIARTSLARRLVNWLETAVLSNLPGYSLMKTVGEEAVGLAPSERHQSVLIRLDDYYQLGFLVERLASGHAVVFLPNAPRPWDGTVVVVEESRVSFLTASSAAAVTCLRRLGDGVGRLVDGKLPPENPGSHS